jgi:energy-coupling factor transporter ATP-binding protein EcfA2
MNKRFACEEGGEAELSEEQAKSGLGFLKSKALFDQIVDDMTTLGYVGEDLNKLLSVLIISQSAAGKSYLVDTVKRLLPESEVINVHSLSDQALNYIEDLMHKFLAFGEAIFNPQVEQQIREMLSSKELSRMIAEKDEKTGEIKGRLIHKKVNVACVMSTTSNNVHPENASRFFVINADESAEQTKKIHTLQKAKYSETRYFTRKNTIPEIISKHQAA